MLGHGFRERGQARYYQKVRRRAILSLGGPVATVLGVLRGRSPGGNRLVILTERNLYVTRTRGIVRFSFPGMAVARHPIESVKVSFDPGMPLSKLIVEDQEITFMGQRRRAKEIIDTICAAQPNG